MYTQEDVKKVQTCLLKMAKQVCGIFEKHNIPYFISYGTLLGAVRHKGFIPWDDDLDLYLFEDSYANALRVLREELPKDCFVEDETSEPKYFHGWAHVKDLHSKTECSLYPQDNAYLHNGVSLDMYKVVCIKENEAKLYFAKQHLAYLERRMKSGTLDKADFLQRNAILKKTIEQEEKKKLDASAESPDVYTLLPSKELFVFEDLFPLKKYRFEDTEFFGPANADIMLKRFYGDYMALPPIERRKPHYSEVQFL